jgi:hypothetical protein
VGQLFFFTALQKYFNLSIHHVFVYDAGALSSGA